jgi:eukaryotic-like serine/threonine-protein kinase
MATEDSVFARLRRLRPTERSGMSSRLLREVVRQRVMGPPSAQSTAAALQLDYRPAVEKQEHEDTLRRLRTAHGIGVLLWPPFGLLDVMVAGGDPALLSWLFGLRAFAFTVVLAMFLALRKASAASPLLPLARVATFVVACVVLSLMCVRHGGIESRYMTGIMLVIMIRAAFIAEPWRTSIAPYLLMWLTFPLTMLVAVPFEPAIAAQFGSSLALTNFVTENFICLSGALTGIACSDAVWRLRREAYEARNLGRYRLKERIGRGGMGEVWIAHHIGLRQDVALKVLTSRGSSEQEAVARFEREVLAITRLSHPNTVRILDHGVTPEGIWFYAMELLRGMDLAALLRREGSLLPARALPMMTQVCDALAEAHRNGVIHRDLKPSNIFVATVAGQSDFIKLLDFGLAKLTHEPDRSELTQDGSVLGTPRYMAPETLDAGRVDPRADIYALGCVMYELLAGRLPFMETSAAGMLRQRGGERPPQLSSVCSAELPPGLEALVMRCLEKNPDDRFDDAGQLRQALRTLS